MQNQTALFFNTSLKSSTDVFHTEGFMENVKVHSNQLGVDSEIVGLADYNIAYGVQKEIMNSQNQRLNV